MFHTYLYLYVSMCICLYLSISLSLFYLYLSLSISIYLYLYFCIYLDLSIDVSIHICHGEKWDSARLGDGHQTTAALRFQETHSACPGVRRSEKLGRRGALIASTLSIFNIFLGK